ncbi:hypothetical protein GCM10023089_36970 [Quisquiliibacterium transsilvanicum]
MELVDVAPDDVALRLVQVKVALHLPVHPGGQGVIAQPGHGTAGGDERSGDERSPEAQDLHVKIFDRFSGIRPKSLITKHK